MRLTIRNSVLLSCVGAMLASCAVVPGGEPRSASDAPLLPATGQVADYPVKIGEPYAVDGVTYTPVDKPGYDDVGYASWYGDEAGATTANGEAFRPDAVTGAHKTLPLPSYVEVTALDTGRTILVRINDRGPFANDRIIDLSRAAAEQLGIMEAGSAPVRVRRVSPPEQERATLRSGARAAERLETPKPLLAVLKARLAEKPRPAAGMSKPATIAPPVPVPVPKAAPAPRGAEATYAPVPPRDASDPFIIEHIGTPSPRPGLAPPVRTAAPAARGAPFEAPVKAATPIRPASRDTGGFIVQIGSFSDRTRADALAAKLGAHVVGAGGIWRVRYGPYPSEQAAQSGLTQAQAAGFDGARIMLND